jgi:hypothetical protein
MITIIALTTSAAAMSIGANNIIAIDIVSSPLITPKIIAGQKTITKIAIAQSSHLQESIRATPFRENFFTTTRRSSRS